MATPVAVAATAESTAGVAFLVGVGAAIVDAKVIMPALQGKGRGAALPGRLGDSKIGSNQPGAPRIWAIGGTGVRIETHILWQKEKELEATTNHTKQGTTINQRQVMVDCLVALNDRQTLELTQLIGNGTLLTWESRNLQRITTNEMTAAASGADLLITMSNTLVPSPTDKFRVGDFVKLRDWVVTAGPDINGYHWRVKTIVGHTSTPGTILLQVVDGQSAAGVTANGGDAFTPARIERVDDALLYDPTSLNLNYVLGQAFLHVETFLTEARDPGEVFSSGDRVKIVNGGPNTSQVEWEVVGTQLVSPTLKRLELKSIQGGNPSFVPPGGTTWFRVEYFSPTTSARGFFADGFVPKDHYHAGTEDQGEDSIIVAALGTGNVSAYRGVAYQAIEEFRVTSFGGQLPYSLEAIIRPDASMTWAQAIWEVLRRAGIPSSAIDVSGVSLAPFLGYYIRGFVATGTSIQPLLLAKQIVTQDRDGTLCMFQIENADVTQIQNGAQFSDLGAHIYGEPRQDDKVSTDDGALEDLPTSIGVRHQDADNVFIEGYQAFGMRNPTGPTQENRQEIDVSTLVLTRKDAKNLATTSLRRAHMNNRRHEWSLTACYLDQLENDIQTLTDDFGNVITGRVAERDCGANYLVKCVALREDLDLAVSGSPVQPAAGQPPPSITTPASFVAVVLDCSSVSNAENAGPMLRFACCAVAGSHWAGGRLYESTDGSNFTAVDTISEQSTIGVLQAATPSVGGSSETYGSAAVTFFNAPVDVTFEFEGLYGIQACTQAEAQNVGRNLCAIVDAATGEVELAAFTQVTLVGVRTYTLNGWLRGLRGTKASVRPAGSRLVMLGPDWEHRTFTRGYSWLSQVTGLAFKFVPAGRTIEEVESIGITATWRNCRPLPIRKLVKTIGPSPFQVRFETEHWTKEHLPVGQVGPYSMDEPFEAYKVSIYDPSGNGVRRIKWLTATPATGTPTLRDKFVDYTPAEQTADGYTPSGATTFVVDVQQVGFLGTVNGLSDSNKRTV